MKHFILLFLPLIHYYLSPAQTDSLQPPADKIMYLTKLLDSLPYFIQKGHAHLSAKRACDLPGHDSYFIPHNLVSISEPALKYTGKKRRAYIEMRVCADVAGEFYRKQDYTQTKKWILKALEISIKNSFYFEELHGYREQLNNVLFHLGDYSEAMKISTEGLIKAERINDRDRMAHYNNVLGYIMMKQKNFELSEKYYSTELALARQLKNKMEEAKALLNLTDLYISQQKELSRALSLIQNAQDIYKEIHVTHPGYDSLYIIHRTAYCSNKLSEVYELMEDYKEALQHSLFAIKISKKTVNEFHGNLYDVSSYYINAGDLYNKLQKPDSALYYSRIGLQIADSIKHRENLRDAYEQISLSFAIIQNFDSAYIYEQFFTKLKDSIADESNRQDILMRDADLRVERDRRIQEVKLSQQQTWRNIIIGISILVILIIVMLYNRRRIKQKMLYQKELNKQQNELMNAVILTQDKERKRIAEDLHDSLGSILSAAKLKLSGLAEATSASGNGQTKSFDDTMNLLDEAVNEMRTISHNLLPASLLRLGLVAGLQNLFDKISAKSGLHINFNTYGFRERLDEPVEVSIYRIILEAVNNVIKHARAKNVTVQLMQYETYINILVEDDGIGFDRDGTLQGQGIGLNNIFSRVDHMKGKVDIDTRLKAGTVINIDIPYQKKIR
jgi:two-component system, NarL family, sensor kinase